MIGKDYSKKLSCCLQLAFVLILGTSFAQLPSIDYAFFVCTGTSYQTVRATTTDQLGNIYVTGQFSSTTDFDPSPAVANLVSIGPTDIFIAKYDPSGNYLWAFRVGGDSGIEEWGMDIKLDSASNILVSGMFNDTADFDPSINTFNLIGSGYTCFLAKYTPNGAFVWAFSLKGFDNTAGRSIATDDSSNIYMCGQINGTVDFDPSIDTFYLSTGVSTMPNGYLAKYNKNGTFQWAFLLRTNAISYSEDICIDDSANIYMTGYCRGPTDFNGTNIGDSIFTALTEDIFLAKYSTTGALQFAFIVGSGNSDRGTAITRDSLDNIYVTGNFDGLVDFDPSQSVANILGSGYDDLFLAKYNKYGNYLWAFRIGDATTSFDDRSNSLDTDREGNVYITGRFYGTPDFDPSASVYSLQGSNLGDIFIAKYSPAKALVWAFRIGPFGSDQGWCIHISRDSSIFVTGYSEGPDDFDPSPNSYILNGNSRDGFLVKYKNCTSPPPPLNLTLPSNPTVCSGNTVSLTAGGAGTLQWFATPTGGTPLATGAVYQTPPLSANSTYFVEDSTCTTSLSRTAITVTVLSNTGSNQNPNICWGQSVTVGPNTYSTTGIYQDTFPSSNGCDSIVITNLYVFPQINVATTVNANTIIANNSTALYQWIDCTNGFSPITGAVNQSYTPASSGSYAVILIVGMCSDTSTCVNLSLGQPELAPLSIISLYPNPTAGVFFVESVSMIQAIKMYNVLGDVVYSQFGLSEYETKIDLSEQPEGIYLLELFTKECIFAKKIVINKGGSH